MLIDGFLRNAQQMYYFLLHSFSSKRNFVAIHLGLSKERALERLMRRAELEGRADDTPDAIQQRFAIYEQETAPVVNYLDSIGKVIHINGDQSIETVASDIFAALKQAGYL